MGTWLVTEPCDTPVVCLMTKGHRDSHFLNGLNSGEIIISILSEQVQETLPKICQLAIMIMLALGKLIAMAVI